MTDETTPAAAPAPTPAGPQTDPLAKSTSTLEGKLAIVGVLLGIAGTVAPPFLLFVTDLSKAFPNAHYLATIVSIVGMALAALTATGYAKARSDLKATIVANQNGVVTMKTLGLMLAVALTVVGVAGCATFGSASGSTGRLDLGKGFASTTTFGPTDQTTCLKPVTTIWEVPEPKDASGTCSFLALDTGKLDLGKGYKCSIAAAPGQTPCIALVTATCQVPIPKDSTGVCP